MKITVEIASPLLEAAERRAMERGTTLGALVEQGLRRVLHAASAERDFVLRDVSVGGDGPWPEVREALWERMVELPSEGRGG